MLIEFRVWGSKEWYEVVVPMLEKANFVALPDLDSSDPETDGEMMYIFYDYSGTALTLEEFSQILNDVKEIILKGEAPSIEIHLVKDA